MVFFSPHTERIYLTLKVKYWQRVIHYVFSLKHSCALLPSIISASEYREADQTFGVWILFSKKQSELTHRRHSSEAASAGQKEPHTHNCMHSRVMVQHFGKNDPPPLGPFPPLWHSRPIKRIACHRRSRRCLCCEFGKGAEGFHRRQLQVCPSVMGKSNVACESCFRIMGTGTSRGTIDRTTGRIPGCEGPSQSGVRTPCPWVYCSCDLFWSATSDVSPHVSAPWLPISDWRRALLSNSRPWSWTSSLCVFSHAIFL